MSNQALEKINSRFGSTLTKAIGAAVILAAVSSMPVAAETGPSACAPRPALLKELSKQYKEAPVALGLAKNGSVIEVLSSDDGETWTIMISQANGASCVVATGEGWEEVKRVGGKGERGA